MARGQSRVSRRGGGTEQHRDKQRGWSLLLCGAMLCNLTTAVQIVATFSISQLTDWSRGGEEDKSLL